MQPQQTSLGAGRKVSLLAFQELSENPTENLQIATGNLQNSTEDLPPGPQTAYGKRSSSGSVNSSNSESLLTNVLSSLPVGGTMQPQTSALSDLVCAMASSERPNVPASTSLTSHQTSSTIIVMEITPPVIGMTFSCYKDAREFYDAYSMRVGFGTKVKSSSFDRKTNEKNLVLLTCCKQGYKNESNIVCYRRPNVRVGCNAHLKIKLNDDKQWKVISVELEHNHECSPSKSRRFRSHKHMESGSKRRLELNCNSGVSLPKSYRTFVREAGGYEHVPFDQRDAQNHIDKYRRLQLKEGDAESMHKYFRKMQTKCSDFFYMIDLDEEGRLKNVFWADERSRAAYSYFGDVVTFDTTYLTNWYDLKFAPFVGVNHHGQSVLFGCGLLANETVESFIWLFKAWLTAMPRCPPDAIITDQCKAIEMAIIDVFPNARHRLCLWHIMKKISEKLGSLSEYKAIKKAMKNAVYDSLRINEFEMVWASFINRYRLQDNAWLTTLYSLRRQWVPVFLKDNFFAGMSTTQRSESMNAFFDGYVHSKTSLKEFVDQYEFALEEKYEKESKADFDSFNSFPSMKTRYYFERQIASVYTRGMFQNFQDELHGIGLCSKSEVKVEGQIITYAIKERTFDKKGNLSTPVIYEVFFNKDEVDVFCICRLFQYKGILCKHALCVLNEFVDEIPSQYILRRWRKDFKRKYVENRLPVNVDLKNPVQRYDVLHPYALQILEEGALSETKYKIVMDGLLDLKRKVLNADGGHEASDIEESQTPFNNGAESMQSEHVKLKNPLQATKIGRPKGRLISSSEKNVKSKITKQKKVSSKAKDSQTSHKNESSQKKANVGRDCEDDGGLPIRENQFPSQETIFEDANGSYYHPLVGSQSSYNFSQQTSQTYTQLLQGIDQHVHRNPFS